MELRFAPLLSATAFVRAALGLAFSLLTIRIVGAESFGYFSLVWAFSAAFLYMYTGINIVLVARMVETRAGSGDRVWIAAGFFLTLMVVAFVVVVAATAAAFAPNHRGLYLVMMITPLVLACQIVTMFCCAVLEGRGHIARATLLPIVGTFGIVLLLVASLAAGWPVEGLLSLLAVVLLAYILEMMVAVGATWHVYARIGQLRWRSTAMKKLILGGVSTQAANIVSFLLDPWSKSVLALYLGPASVAVFDLSMKVGWGLNSVFSAYSRLFLQIPQSDQSRRIASLAQAAALTWVPLVLIGSIAVSVLPPVLSSWLRVDAKLLAQGMAMAVTACLLMAAVSAAYISLIAFHDHKFILRNQMILGLANVVAAPLLVPVIGFTGAFLGSLVGTVINVGLISRRLRHHMPEFSGLTSLACKFPGRSALAISTYTISCTASVWASSAVVGGALAFAAAVLLLREPLARATWEKINGKKG